MSSRSRGPASPTASGTTLTFDEAPPSGTNNVYVIYRGKYCQPRQSMTLSRLSATTGRLAAQSLVHWYVYRRPYRRQQHAKGRRSKQ